MNKYMLTTCTQYNKEFNCLDDLIKLLATDKITELSNYDICFLDAGMDITRNNKDGKFMYKVEVIAN
jgi:hypothetical protein